MKPTEIKEVKLNAAKIKNPLMFPFSPQMPPSSFSFF